jgi:hypothetical protein
MRSPESIRGCFAAQTMIQETNLETTFEYYLLEVESRGDAYSEAYMDTIMYFRNLPNKISVSNE